jgi:predicted RNase H-like nuclease
MPLPGRRRAVLGIDASWTEGEPSGVALVVERSGAWTAAAVAPSYATFVALASGAAVDWDAPAMPGGATDAGALLGAAARLAPDAEVVVAALDLPLARTPIVRRRVADDALSRAYGARGCGVHSPTDPRLAAASERLHRSFIERSFALATAAAPRHPRALLEVFPHTALLALLPSPYRVQYKVARAGRYWPARPPAERRAALLAEWRRIHAALAARITGLALALALPASPPAAGRMKRHEDALDAVICAWAGIEFLAGRASAYGDATATIWTP